MSGRPTFLVCEILALARMLVITLACVAVGSSAEAQREPASHRSALRAAFDRTIRMERSKQVTLADGRRFAVTLASTHDGPPYSFVLAFSPLGGRPVVPVANEVAFDVYGPRSTVLRFEVMVIPSDREGHEHVFVELAVSNASAQAAYLECAGDEYESYEYDEDEDYDEDDDVDCGDEPPASAYTSLFVIDPVPNRIVLDQDVSSLQDQIAGRFRVIDDDDDGSPEVLIESFDCASVYPDSCDIGPEDGTRWDARLRQAQVDGVDAGETVYLDMRRFCFDRSNATPTYIPCVE